MSNGAPNGTTNQRNLIKNDTWNEVDKTWWKCVKIDAPEPSKTNFPHRIIAKITETRGANKSKNVAKGCSPKSMKIDPRAQQKTMLKIIPRNCKK